MEPESIVVGPIDGPILPLATGAPFPQAATVTVFQAKDRVVTLRLRVQDGRPVLVRLSLGSHEPADPKFASLLEREAPEVSASEVHALAVDRLVDAAVRAVGLAVGAATPSPHRYDVRAAADGAVRARRRHPMTDDLLEDVARVAVSYPSDAIGEIRRQFHTSQRTAYRWLSEARRRGLLSPNEKEQPQP